MIKMAETVMARTARVHYFDRQSGTTRDISALDPFADEASEAGWGGLAEFSGRANDAVANAVSNANRK
jgi:hypothetical protein